MTRLATATLCTVLASAAIGATRPPVVSYPASTTNYTRANRSMVTQVVIHKAQGSNSAAWSANPRANSSSHYDVHYDGQIFYCVPEDDIAWHAGNWNVNANSIGIEHAGYAQRADTTPVQYRNSARLVAYICVRYRIPIDRRHIIGHAEVPHPTIPGRFGGRNAHWDPGPHWNWAHFMNLVRSYAGGAAPPPPPPPPAGIPNLPTLRQGARGEAVKAMQRLLRDRGFSPGPIDGYFGPQTTAKVRAFQQSRRIVVDGVVGNQTWAELAKPSPTAPAPAPAPAAPAPPAGSLPPGFSLPTLRQGARGEAVKTMQRLLRDRGFSPGPIDGYFGPQTTGKVRQFQQSRGLVVDGVVGNQTWAALARATPTPAAPAPAAPAPAPSYPPLRHGARGSAVVTLQNLLRAKGFDPGPSDGYFGNMTLAAVRRFQSARGLAVDGYVGPQTWGALTR